MFRLDPDPAAVVQKKGSSNLTSAEYSQLHPRTTKQHIPMVNKKTTSKSGFNWYVGRNFGLELINYLSQGRSKASSFLNCVLEVYPILVHVDTAGGRCLRSRTQEPGWVSLVLTQRGHVGDVQEGEMTLVKKLPEGESCVSLSMGITGLDSSEDVGMAGCGWEKWSCGLRLLQELRKVARWRL